MVTVYSVLGFSSLKIYVVLFEVMLTSVVREVVSDMRESKYCGSSPLLLQQVIGVQDTLIAEELIATTLTSGATVGTISQIKE